LLLFVRRSMFAVIAEALRQGADIVICGELQMQRQLLVHQRESGQSLPFTTAGHAIVDGMTGKTTSLDSYRVVLLLAVRTSKFLTCFAQLMVNRSH